MWHRADGASGRELDDVGAALAVISYVDWSSLDITALGRQEEWEDSPEGYPHTRPAGGGATTTHSRTARDRHTLRPSRRLTR